jgi:1,4-alpha-glucan branching enzyme
MVIGSFCLVLHGHMPYVLRHGTWPHGEDWLYEAAAEVYLPLLAVIDECQYLKGNPRLTIGLTPILLEQLAHEDFKRGFETYLQNRITQARSDQNDFKRLGESHLAHLATRWEQFYLALAEQFISMDRNIPKAFVQRVAGGLIQLLTSSATHAYLPLLLEDSSIRAQVRAGMSSSKQILGFTPKGMWLPEGAYRPGGPWKPAIQWGQGGYRIGIDRLIADEGITHFFVDDHLGMNSPIDRLGNGGFQKMAEPQEGLDSNGYTSYSPHEPVWVGGDSSARRTIAAFTRDPHICKQVWCGISGYPADGTYLEFHKRQGEKRGLRSGRLQIVVWILVARTVIILMMYQAKSMNTLSTSAIKLKTSFMSIADRRGGTGWL